MGMCYATREEGRLGIRDRFSASVEFTNRFDHRNIYFNDICHKDEKEEIVDLYDVSGVIEGQ